MPTGFREALVLRDLQGLNYREIARITVENVRRFISKEALLEGTVL